MELKTEITKEVFERIVPVAKAPERNTSVFSRMEDMLETAYSTLVSDVIGEAFASAAEGVGVLKTEMLRYVCLTAFVKAARSLDLVLTSTGFGIVSTESTAPASASRVNALLSDLRLQALLSRERIVEKLRLIDGWGLSAQATECIGTLFYRPSYVSSRCTLPLTSDSWQIVLQRSLEADAILREELSPEYVDHLLLNVRTFSLSSKDAVIVDKCLTFMSDFISNYDELDGFKPNLSDNMKNNRGYFNIYLNRKEAQANMRMLSQIVDILESHPCDYPIYKNSPLYKKRHAERYENRSEDPSFFFM